MMRFHSESCGNFTILIFFTYTQLLRKVTILLRYVLTLAHSLENYLITLEPSNIEFKSCLRQIAEGIHELILNGLYHGNFNMKTSYFDKNSKLVKLAQFQRVEMSKEDAQFNDWNAVGKGLKRFHSCRRKFILVETIQSLMIWLTH